MPGWIISPKTSAWWMFLIYSWPSLSCPSWSCSRSFVAIVIFRVSISSLMACCLRSQKALTIFKLLFSLWSSNQLASRSSPTEIVSWRHWRSSLSSTAQNCGMASSNLQHLCKPNSCKYLVFSTRSDIMVDGVYTMKLSLVLNRVRRVPGAGVRTKRVERTLLKVHTFARSV